MKPVFHFIGSRVETRRLSSYGSTACNLYTPTTRLDPATVAEKYPPVANRFSVA